MEPLKTWLEKEELDENRQTATEPAHIHYRELSRVILKNCSENMKDADEISQLIEVRVVPYDLLFSICEALFYFSPFKS